MPVTWEEIDTIRSLYQRLPPKELKLLTDDERAACENHPYFEEQTGNFVHVPLIRGKTTIRCQYLYDNDYIRFFRTCCAGLDLTKGVRLALGFSFITNDNLNQKTCCIPSKLLLFFCFYVSF